MAEADDGNSPAAEEEPEDADDLENGNDLDAEEEDEGDAADLEGFLAEEGEGTAEGGGGEGGGSSSSSSSGSEADDQDLNEDDLDMLREAGLDVSASAAAAVEGSGEKRKHEASLDDDLGEEGDLDEEGGPPKSKARRGGGLFAAAANAMGGEGGDDDFNEFSMSSMDEFVVQDPAARRGNTASELGITEDQKKEIILIFGDTSVLRPLDSELPDAAMDAALDTDEEEEGDAQLVQRLSQGSTSRGPSASQGASLPVVAGTSGVSQRWSQTYLSEPSLLTEGGTRVWSGTEEEAEADWIYQEVFRERQHQVDFRVRRQAILDVLDYLHSKMLEPAVIAQLDVFFGEALTREDVYVIADMDQRWQPLWKSYRELEGWLKQVNAPVHIDARLRPRVFTLPKAELHIKDTKDWFLINYPELIGTSNSDSSATPTRRLAKEALKEKLDEQLGLKKAGEGDLNYVAITPQELGDNLYNQRQLHKPNVEVNERPKAEIFEIAGRRMKPPRAPALAEEMVISLLATRLAVEPRVREFVRKEFRRYCAISTYVTDGGKSMAEECAWNFRENYRAFHIVHRPWNEFGVDERGQDDPLFMDVMDLQRRGFIALEYSLILPPEDSVSSRIEHAGKCKYIVMGHDKQDIPRDRGKLLSHIGDQSFLRGADVASIEEWTWCRDLTRRLEGMARVNEVHERLKGGDKTKETVLFQCANISIGSDDLNKLICPDPIYGELLDMYCQVDTSEEEKFRIENPWNTLRKSIVRRALLEELYPTLWAEVQSDLARQAEEIICRACSANLANLVDRQPWQPWTQSKSADKDDDWKKNDWKKDDWNNKDDYWSSWDKKEAEAEEEEDPEIHDPDSKSEKAARLRGYISAFVIVPEILDNFCVVTYVNQFGDPVDARKFFTQFYQKSRIVPEKGSFEEVQANKKQEHQDIFKQMLKLYQPAVIIIPMVDQSVIRLKEGVSALVDEVHNSKNFRSKPEIIIGDPTIPRLVAFDVRCMEQGAYKDCISPLQRLALSCVRFVQDPLAEASQLWSDAMEENSLLKLRLHRLQDSLPRNRLTRTLERTLVECVGKAGIHVNRLRHTNHMLSVVKFLPGFGCQRQDLFRRCLGNAIKSRQELVERIVTTFCGVGACKTEQECAPIIANCTPFIKILPDLRDNWSARETPAFDRTRLNDSYHLWLMSMCQAAIENVSIDEVLIEGLDDPIAKAMKVFDKEKTLRDTLDNLIQGGKWDWSHVEGAEIADTLDADRLMDLFIAEVVHPFRDQRQPYAPPEGQHLFSLTVAEPAECYARGTIVYTIVKRDTEVPDDDAAAAKANVKVEVTPCGVNGSFPKQHKMGEGKGYIDGCERTFQPGEQVLARVIRTNASADRTPMILLTVDKSNEDILRNFPITKDDVRFYMPTANEDWSLKDLGVVGLDEKDELVELKRKIQRPRNIRHPNWFEQGHNEAVKLLHRSPLGHMLFRPSKRHDAIVGMLKVRSTSSTNEIVKPSECYRHFDIFEKKDAQGNGFELCSELICEGETYSDLDEIIARHMDPIMDNLKILQEHPRFGLHSTVASVTNKADVISNLEKFSKDNYRMLMYSLILHPNRPGQGMLLWTTGGMRVKEELLEVRPRGFALWGKQFEKLPQLVKWFKMTGWQEAFKRRKAFKEEWLQKEKAIKSQRGQDAMKGAKKKADVTAQDMGSGLLTPGMEFNSNPRTARPGWNVADATGGLLTPGGLQTPRGMATPARLR